MSRAELTPVQRACIPGQHLSLNQSIPFIIHYALSIDAIQMSNKTIHPSTVMGNLAMETKLSFYQVFVYALKLDIFISIICYCGQLVLMAP